MEASNSKNTGSKIKTIRIKRTLKVRPKNNTNTFKMASVAASVPVPVTPILMPRFQTIINTNPYINERKETKCDPHSFCGLASRSLDQSENIKLGICMENFFYDIVANTPGWVSIRPDKVLKGEKETDHLFVNNELKKLYYAEQKNNINLDTEKSKSTVSKVEKIKADLIKKYPDYTVEAFIFAARYISNTEPIVIKIVRAKYSSTDIKVLCVNEYLSLFGIEEIKGYDEYKAIIKAIIAQKFD